MSHLMKSVMAVVSLVCLPELAGAAVQGVLSDTTYTITVAENDEVALNASDVAQLNLGNMLVKKGKGRLIIDRDLAATYDGEIIVEEGFLRATCGNKTGTCCGLGGTNKGTVVKKGATLEMVGVSGENECANGEPITFEGSGVDGVGAIYRYSGGNIGYGLFAESKITMTGDATVGSKTAGHWFRIRNTCIDMAGHNLTFQNADLGNGFKGGDSNAGPVINPGNIIVEEGAAFCLENANSRLVQGSAANKLVLKAGSSFVQAVAVSARGGWTLQVDGAAKIVQNSNVTSGAFGWDGPITLNDTLTIQSANASFPLEFNGAVSGTGALVYAGMGKTLMKGDATRVHAYTGGTRFDAGCHVAIAAPGLVPTTAGAITAAAGAQVLFQPQTASDNSLFTATAVSELSRAMSAGVDRAADVVIVGRDDTWPAYFVDDAAVCGTADAPVKYSGFLTNSETRITGELSGFVNLAVRPSTTVRLATSGLTESWTEVNGGTLVIPAGVTLTASNRVYVGGADNAHFGRLKVEGTLDMINESLGWRGVSATSQAFSGNVRTTERGIVEVAAGGVVNGYLGLNQGGCIDGVKQTLDSQGLYLVKGTVSATAESFVGDFRSEYLEVGEGGLINSWSIRAGRGAGAYANIRVMAGGRIQRAVDNSNINLAYNGGQTDMLVDGGQVDMLRGAFAMNSAEGTQTDAYTAFTVCDGGEVRFSAPGGGDGWRRAFVNRSNNSFAYLNLLDGGLLEAAPLSRDTGRTGNRSVVSFDGGIYAMRYNSSGTYRNQNCFQDFEAGEGTAGDHVFVFAKGAAISNDTPTYVGFTMEAPTGKGVEAIALPAEIAGRAAWSIPGPPMVRITDATGYGATAIALYDAENGKVSAIKVTSRGVNYTNPTITFSKGGMSAAESYTGCCTLTDNVSGGLTKMGTGTLFVTNAMTYTGATVVAQGTLQLGLDHALDSSREIVVASGATFDLNGKACTPAISGFGHVVGSPTLPVDWTLDAETLNAATTAFSASGDVMIPVGTTITIENADELDISRKYVLAQAEGALVGFCPTLVCETARPWALTKTNHGLTLAFVRGMVINIR